MTADELARVTAERDVAVAALARVEALADEWDAMCPPGEWPEKGGVDTAVLADAGRMVLAALKSALVGPESDADGEVAPAGSEAVCGAQKPPFECSLPPGHEGPHQDVLTTEHPVRWPSGPPPVPMPTWDRNGPTGEAMR